MPAMREVKEKEPTARDRLRTWIQSELKGKSEVNLPELTERAVTFVSKDRKLLNAMLLELLRPMVYEEARLIVAHSRGEPPAERMHQLGDDLVSRNGLSERARRMSRKWLEFTEHAGDRHVLLLDMTAEDLALAEAESKGRGDVEYAYAGLWAKLRTRLENGQRVRDVWTVQEIEAAYQSAKAA